MHQARGLVDRKRMIIVTDLALSLPSIPLVVRLQMPGIRRF